MRFVVDAQLPPLLARWLREQGHEAQHVVDIQLAAADDGAIWSHCCAVAAVLLTKDDDFVGLKARTPLGPAVCWLRVGNSTNPALIDWFSKVFPQIVTAIEAGESLIEVR